MSNGNMVLQEKYKWKELSEDGLLKEPPEYGSHYLPIRLNDCGKGYDGFDTEDEAKEALMSQEKYHYTRLVLVKEYYVGPEY